jgi:hypothetical protein
MTRAVERVDRILDAMELASPGFDSVSRNDIVSAISCTPQEASVMLQKHRNAQKTGRTRWILNCRGYGKTAVWYVMGGPGRTSGDAERLAIGHAAHIAKDLNQRAISDIARELRPAAMRNPVVQALIAGFCASIETQTNGLANMINVALDTYERATGTKADLRGVA